MKKGDYMKKAKSNKYKEIKLIIDFIDEYQLDILSKEEQIKLFISMEQGNFEAREQLILHNLCLVISIAKNYKDKVYDISELFNVGCLGLIKAIEKFDYKKGFCFSTYAKHWIEGYINRYLIKNYFNFNAPIRYVTESIKIKKFILKYYSYYGKKPSDSEMASKLHLSEDKIVEYKALLDTPISLNKIIYDKELSEDFIPEYELIEKIPEEDNCIEEYEKKYMNELFRNCVFSECNLTDRQKEVLWYYFGFETGEPMDCKEIVDLLKISRQRVQEIMQRAIEKLQNEQKIKQFNSKLMIKR